MAYTINMLLGLSIVSFWLTPYWTYRKQFNFLIQLIGMWKKEGKKDDEIDKTS